MKKQTTLTSAVLSLALITAGAVPVVMLVTHPAHAADKKKQQQLSSAKVGSAVKEIQDLVHKEDYQNALAKAQDALKLPDLKPYDIDVIDDFLGQIYYGLKDYANAAASFDAAFQTGAVPDEFKESRLKITTQLYLQAENFPKAIEYANRYISEVGETPEMLGYLGEAQYYNKDLKGAVEVTLIEPQKNFTTCFFSNIHLGGYRSFQSITHNYNKVRKEGVKVVHEAAASIDRDKKQVVLAGGKRVSYDRLVVAPGIDIKFDSVPGYWSAGVTIQ